MLARGYQVLAVNYAGSTGAGMALRSSLYHDQRAAGEQALLAALGWVSTQTASRDYQPVLLAGSYGSYIAALNPDYFERFHAVILSSGVYNPANADTPIQRLTTDYSNLFKDASGRLVSPFEVQVGRLRPRTKVLILHGADDQIARPADAARYAQFLKERGIVASSHIVKGAGHADLLFQRFEIDTLPATQTVLANTQAFKRRSPVR
jgi:dipeptidyl aminopeptidase/acylaminoacyl peptidase